MFYYHFWSINAYSLKKTINFFKKNNFWTVVESVGNSSNFTHIMILSIAVNTSTAWEGNTLAIT